MKHLYIIGNGFDIHHGIPSRYINYRDWLEEHNPYALSRIEEYFDQLTTLEEWNCFEQQLANKDFYSYASEVARNSWPDFSSDEFRDRDYHASEINAENDSLNICETVIETFSEWIDSLPFGNVQQKLIFERESSFFITFNYTRTLEKMYNIPVRNILHIHGCQGDEEYILGHGKSQYELDLMSTGSLPDPPEDMNPEQYDEWYSDHGCDPFIEQAKDAAIRQIATMQKNVAGIIKANQTIFSSFKEVQTIHVYGFSFSPIDMPYLDEVVRNVDMSSVTWELSYYTLEDKQKAEAFVAEYQIPASRYSLVNLEQLKESNLQYKLDFTLD